MSWWWFAFGSLVVIGLFSNFGAMVAKWAESLKAEPAEPAPTPEPKPLPRFERGKRASRFGPRAPAELWLEDGRVLLNEDSTINHYGWWWAEQRSWFDPNTGALVDVSIVADAHEKQLLRERLELGAARARKYGGVR